MSEERHNERDSQLSAMFDGELAAAECELLARRLTRDETLRSLWSRYSMIGAALRAERGVALDDRVAWRVQSVIAQETSYGDASSVDSASPMRASANAATGTVRATAGERWMRFARPVVGASIAAGVAAMSIIWLQGQVTTDSSLIASNPIPQSVVLKPETVGTTVALNRTPAVVAPSVSGEPERYSTPAPSSQTSLAPQARLANYVVAHSEYSGPLSRRMALLGLVASEGAGDAALPSEGPAPANTEPSNAH